MDVPHKIIADPKTHYGDGRSETRWFIVQRITGALNLLFLLFLVWFVLTVARADHAQFVATVRNPFVAIVLALLVINVPMHMRIGMREIIVDYVHEPRLHRFCLMINVYFAVMIGLLGLLAIIKIIFWG
jgi:succinate dehydrogenase / fumarate reductase membrane anchor subunit